MHLSGGKGFSAAFFIYSIAIKKDIRRLLNIPFCRYCA